MSTITLSETKNVGFWRLFGLTVGGIVLYAYAYVTAGGFVDTAGNAAIYVGVLGAIVVLLVSVPILEYARLVRFAGGYYGLAELGFGKAVGKFTALSNYFYYFFWQPGTGLLQSMTMMIGYYIITGVLPPAWLFIVVALVTVTAYTLVAVYNVNLSTKIILASVVVQFIIVIVSSVYVIARSPYNSLTFLNPDSAPGGFSAIALGASIAGFLTFTGYGSALFYTEEGKEAKRVAWKAIIIGVLSVLLIGSLSVYSELAAVKNIGTVSSSAIPLLTAYGSYIGTYGLIFFYVAFLPIIVTSLAAGTGAYARLVWSLSRDNFWKNKWMRKLKSNVPVNAALFNLMLSYVFIIVVSLVMLNIYGYSESTLFFIGYAPLTASVIAWYFHHFIPDLALGVYIHKFKIKVSRIRFIITAIVTPLLGVGIFSYAFYAGIISNAVEPYLAFVIAAIVFIAAGGIFVVYKTIKHQLGESYVDNLAEKEGIKGP